MEFVATTRLGFDAMIEVLAPDGSVALRNDDGGIGQNAYGVFCADQDGEYTLTARAANMVNGRYLLRAVSGTPVSFSGPVETETTYPDGVAEDRLVDDEVDIYRIDLDAGDTVAITQFSQAFDTLLALLIDDRMVVQNDDAFDTSSQIIYTAPVADTYTIAAGAFFSVAVGDYTLRVVAVPPPTEPETLAGDSDAAPIEVSDQGTIAIGDSVTGELNANRHSYTLTGEAGTTLIIRLSSDDNAVDTLLRVRDAAGGLLDENDDGGEGLNSELTITLPYTGDYSIVAGSFSDNAIGPYTLSVERAE